MNQPFQLSLSNSHIAQAIQINYAAELPTALAKLGLQGNRPVLVLVGGASGISPESMARLTDLFVGVLAPLAVRLGACVISGGTDAGIMRLIGQARAQLGATFPLVGVAAVGTVILPHMQPLMADAAPLEPHHSHFVLVPGKLWGDESPWIAQVANVLTQGTRSTTLLINGGQIAWMDVTNSVKAGRTVVVVAGSGRTADTLAAMLRGEKKDDSPNRLTASGLLQAVDLSQGFDAIAHRLNALLTLV